MFAPSGGGFAGEIAGGGAGLVLEVSPRLAALAGALGRLLTASDGVAEALTRHDRIALEKANSVAAEIVDEVDRLAAALTEDDRAMLDEAGIVALRARLGVAARRNAFLIEQAWAIDAALMRLMIGGGRTEPAGPTASYNAAPGPAYVDRGA